jgi:hypothetical protein
MPTTSPSPSFPSFPNDAQVVSPSNSSDFSESSVLWIGGAGNVRVTTDQGSDVTFTGVLSNTTLPVRVKRVWSTGTTATNIVRVF